MDYEICGERRREHLRRVIEEKTGRPLSTVIRDLYRDREERIIPQLACVCTRLAGEKVDSTVVEEWLDEYEPGLEERWSEMAPKLRQLLERLIQSEVDRRLDAQRIRAARG